MQPRNKLIAAFLNLFVWGLGYLYVGRARRAAFFLFAYFAAYFVFGLCGFLSTWTGYAGISILLGALKLYTVVDVFLIAHRTKKPVARGYMKVPMYVVYALIVTGTIHMFQQYRGDMLGYEAITIPGNYLAPTIRQGDYILVDT